jgi:hypothetical protein
MVNVRRYCNGDGLSTAYHEQAFGCVCSVPQPCCAFQALT